MLRGQRSQRLLALCAAGAMAFNFPLLALWDRVLSNAEIAALAR